MGNSVLSLAVDKMQFDQKNKKRFCKSQYENSNIATLTPYAWSSDIKIILGQNGSRRNSGSQFLFFCLSYGHCTRTLTEEIIVQFGVIKQEK